MRIGIVCLVLAYVLSQFYRAFLAVLSPVLSTDTGASAQDLAAASGLWFLAFALMQLPVGSALDRIGPRRTTSALLCICALGAVVFALAEGPLAIKVAMLLIGAGCSSVLMSAYYIFARLYPPAIFGTLAGMMIGIGSIGNIASALPLAWAAETFGWRSSVGLAAVLTLATALTVHLMVRDPGSLPEGPRGSLLDLLRMRALWPILAMMAACYAPAAGIRGFWVGPYMGNVFNAGPSSIGTATLIMGLAMIAGNFAYGPLDRALGTRKWLIIAGNLPTAICLLALWSWPAASGTASILLLASIGFFGASFPVVIAHGRAFLPPHLVGRGVTLLNLFGIGAVGLMQVATGRLHASMAPVPGAASYAAVFLFFAIMLLIGIAIYAFSRDRID